LRETAKVKIKKAIIIGGGIGGHTLAVALHQAGIASQLFERAPQLGEVGAGLGVWANAVRVLDRLSIGARIREIGMPLERGEIVSWRGRVLSSMDIQGVATEAGAGCYVMHRADLLEAIVSKVPPGVARAGMECVRIEQGADSVRAHFQNGKTAEGDILIGADGINSVVRRTLWGEEPLRYSGQTCYRGVAHVPPDDSQVIREISGPGKRCAVCPLDKHRIYWWAAINSPLGEKDDPQKRRDYLVDQYRGWPFNISEAMAATPVNAVLRNDLVDRPPLARWSKGRVTLLGDSAHPTTPNLGQGACMAIEDAMVLARALASHATVDDAFGDYEQQRSERTAAVTKESWNFGMLALWKNPAAVELRELLFRSTPAFVLKRTLRRHVAFDVGGWEKTSI
jgi:2-polyprenyl-6-methoxyphenol hydroxylase-like FAD-dependent oxidoreductase